MKKLILILSSTLLIAIAQSQTISPYFFGINSWMPDTTGSRFLNGKVHSKWKEIKQTMPQSIRFGGISSDRDAPTKYQYLKMVDSIRSVGAEPILQVSFWSGKYSASQAAEIVKFINIEKKRNVIFWSIGNEPDHSGSYGYTSASQVAPYVKSFASAMKNVDSTIKIIAPECAWYNRNIMDALTSPGGTHDITGKNSAGRFYVDYISFHQYPFSGSQTREQVISELTASGKFQDRLAELNNRLQNCNQHHGRTGSNALKSAVTEANIAYKNTDSNNTLTGLGTRSFIGGQFWAEMMAVAIRRNVEFINFWGVTNAFGYLDGDVKRPSYYHFQMMAEHFKGGFCNGNTGRNNVKAFGAKNNNQIAVMILNQSSGTNFNYTIKLNNNTVSGSNPLKININAAVDKDYSSIIQNQSTTLLIFDAAGNLMKKCEYKMVGHADKNLAPTCNTYGPPAVITTSRSTDLCDGEDVILSTAKVEGYTYQWRRNGANINGATSHTFTANSAGSYSVIVSNQYKSTTSQLITVTLNNPSAIINYSGSNKICQGGSLKLNANTGTGLTYQWRRNSIDIAGAIGTSYIATTAGSYRVVVTQNGCSKTSDGVPVEVLNIPLAEFISSPPYVTCDNNPAIITASEGNNYNYQWMANDSLIPGENNHALQTVEPGNYVVIISNDCGSNISELVTVESCMITSSDNETPDEFMRVHPNPSTGYIHLDVSIDGIGEEEPVIQIISMTGQIIYSKKPLATGNSIRESINLEGSVSEGIYLLQLTGLKRTFTKKIVFVR
jgi:hypothetical protein